MRIRLQILAFLCLRYGILDIAAHMMLLLLIEKKAMLVLKVLFLKTVLTLMLGSLKGELPWLLWWT